jgi:hypothetical protein
MRSSLEQSTNAVVLNRQEKEKRRQSKCKCDKSGSTGLKRHGDRSSDGAENCGNHKHRTEYWCNYDAKRRKGDA